MQVTSDAAVFHFVELLDCSNIKVPTLAPSERLPPGLIVMFFVGVVADLGSARYGAQWSSCVTGALCIWHR